MVITTEDCAEVTAAAEVEVAPPAAPLPKPNALLKASAAAWPVACCAAAAPVEHACSAP